MELDNRPNDLPEKKNANKLNDSNQNVAVKTCITNDRFLREEISDTETAVWRRDPRRYSIWAYLVGVHARVQRVVNNMGNAEKRVGPELLPEERRDAEVDIIRLIFQEEYRAKETDPTKERTCKFESTLT